MGNSDMGIILSMLLTSRRDVYLLLNDRRTGGGSRRLPQLTVGVREEDGNGDQ